MSVTIGVPDCSTGNRDFLAAQTLQTILVEIVAAERARTPASKFGSGSLVRTMAAANPLWGAPRVHGELLKLGFHHLPSKS